MKMILMIVMLAIMAGAVFFAWQGVDMHKQVDEKEKIFHQVQKDYFLQDKATRDRAPADSELNKNLVEIQQTPSELLRLKLVGVGKILTGIFILLFGILIALMMMPVRLAQEMKKSKK